jgi:predicted branched-subunit amino acid permease
LKMSSPVSPQSEFVAGAKAIAPIMLGVMPFAAIAGIASIDAGLSPGLAVGMSLGMFAGAAHLAAVQLISLNASLPVIFFTVVIINLRFVMYSASLAPHLKTVARRWKPLLAYLLTDQAYAVSITRFTLEPQLSGKMWYYLGAAILMWSGWTGAFMTGVFLGAQVPASWSLDFAVPLTFMALAVPAIKGRAAIASAAAAAVVVVWAATLPFNLSLITAALAGIGVGLLVEWRWPGKEAAK